LGNLRYLRLAKSGDRKMQRLQSRKGLGLRAPSFLIALNRFKTEKIPSNRLWKWKWGEDLPCQRGKNIFNDSQFFLEKLTRSTHSAISKTKCVRECRARDGALFFGKNLEKYRRIRFYPAYARD